MPVFATRSSFLDQIDWASRFSRGSADTEFRLRDVREVVSHFRGESARVVIVRLRDKRFVLVRAQGATEGEAVASPSLVGILQLCSPEELGLLRFDRAMAGLSDDLDSAASLAEAGRLDEASQASAAVFSALLDAGALPAGYGSRAFLAEMPLDKRLDSAARQLREGNPGQALGTLSDAKGERYQRPPSVLDQFFQDSDPQGVLAALSALEDPGSADRDRSWGRVQRSELLGRRGLPEPRGLLCARIFGAMDDLRCSCGARVGPADEGELCPKCSVVCGSSGVRDWRFAHIELCRGVVHPALVGTIAEVLGIGDDQLRALLRGEATLGPDGVQAAEIGMFGDLPEGSSITVVQEALVAAGRVDLLIDRVPVPPPGDRPALTRQVEGVPLPLSLPHPYDEAAIKLLMKANRVERLIELEAPPIIIDHDHHELQQAFTNLMGCAQGPDVLAGWSDESRVVHIAPWPGDEEEWARPEEGEPGDVVAALWLSGDRLLVQRRATTVDLYGLHGTHLEAWPSDKRRAKWSSESGEHVVFLGQYPGATDDGVHGVGVRHRGDWLDVWPQDLAATIVEHEEPEDAYMVDLHTTRGLPVGTWSDRPDVVAWAPNGRVLWVSDDGWRGELIESTTGGRLIGIDSPDAKLVLLADGSIVEIGAAWDDELVPYDGEGPDDVMVCAFVLQDGGALLARADGTIGDEQVAWYRLGVAFRAFAWAPDGGRLLVVTNDEALILMAGPEPVILSRWALAPGADRS